jgi:hypothetical protein
MAGLWPAGWAPSGPPVAATAQAAPLILTVALPDALQRQADAIRGHSRPEAAARAPAHLTLFRHLPGLQQPALVQTLRSLVVGPPPGLRVLPPVRWGDRWVAPVRAPDLDRLRAELADHWHGLLAPGDHAPPRLHISLSQGRAAPPPLPEGPWPARGLLLWRHEATDTRRRPEREGPPFAAERGRPLLAAERGGPFWSPLVAVAFRG